MITTVLGYHIIIVPYSIYIIENDTFNLYIYNSVSVLIEKNLDQLLTY